MERTQYKLLSEEEVTERRKQGLGNEPLKPMTKSFRQIVFENVFTYFNLLFVILAILLGLVLKFSQMGFMVVVILNTLIGVIQQVRCKRAIDKLSLVTSQKVTVHRAKGRMQILSQQLVVDDVFEIYAGMQICADCVVLEGEATVNESLLTGESEDVGKGRNDNLYAGAICTSGSCLVKVTHVKEECYANKLSKEATSKSVDTKGIMMLSLDKLIFWIGIALIPVGLMLFHNEYFLLRVSYGKAIEATVAALIGMIPEGLYLLTSMSLVKSVMKLGKRGVLVKELQSVEKLSCVDVLCVDKTGTITSSYMHVYTTYHVDTISKETFESILATFARTQTPINATLASLREAFEGSVEVLSRIPFDAKYKYSALQCKTSFYVLGAYPQVMKEDAKISAMILPYASQGYRVITLVQNAHVTKHQPIDKTKSIFLGFVVLENTLRSDAKQTFTYIQNQNIAVKVISGDDPLTVYNVAQRANIRATGYIDCQTLSSDQDYEEAAKTCNIFGRATPEDKKKLVQVYKRLGNYVAMQGDGVNDVLALKESDCSIAMAEGSDAVSQLSSVVLLHNDFAMLPLIIQEGRRVINNIEKCAALFMSKNVFSVLMTCFCILFRFNYPLKPLQLSYIGALTIGIPGFFLAMMKNDEINHHDFIKTILKKAVPGGCCWFLMIVALNLYVNANGYSLEETNTLSVFVSLIATFIILFDICRPFRCGRVGLFIGMVLLAISGGYLLRAYLHLEHIPDNTVTICAVFLIVSPFLYYALQKISKTIIFAYRKTGIEKHFPPTHSTKKK